MLAGERLDRSDLVSALRTAAGPLAECRIVLWAWRHDREPAALTTARLAELAARYATRLERVGVPSLTAATLADAAGFVLAPTRKGAEPSIHTMHLRRTTLRTICRTLYRLGCPHPDPTTLLELPSRWFRAVRPLTDAEIHQVRTALMFGRQSPSHAAAVLAFAETGAATSELTRIRWADVTGATVSLPGGRRLLPRTTQLNDWGRTIVDQHRHLHRPALTALVVSRSGAEPGSQPAQAAMTNQLRRLLAAGRLDASDEIGPRSIRLWAARCAYDTTGQIESSAHVLGMRSLDACAAAIGI